MPQGATLARRDETIETGETPETDYFSRWLQRTGGERGSGLRVRQSEPAARSCFSPLPWRERGQGGEGVGGQLDVLMPTEGGRGSSTVCDVAAGFARHLRRPKAATTSN